jgi:hypothetical protein
MLDSNEITVGVDRKVSGQTDMFMQAFESIHYPIIALERKTSNLSANENNFLPQHFQPQQFKPKHHSLLTPRDFDVSPYFAIIKPTVECGFDFHNLEWVE